MTWVYLDHNATSPTLAVATEEWLRVISLDLGNPSSVHRAGREARAILETARETIARSIDAEAHEILFTSGGTESNNLVLQSFARRRAEGAPGTNRILSTEVEHPSIVKTIRALEFAGCPVHFVRVDSNGVVDLNELEDKLQSGDLVSIQGANQETGVLQPLAIISELCERRGALLHTDASQLYCKMPFSSKSIHFQFATLSAHKFGGPVGVGAVFARGSHLHHTLSNRLHGGSQEFDRRPGTTPVALASAFSKAAIYRLENLESHNRLTSELRQRIVMGITSRISNHQILTPLENSVSTTLCCAFPGCDRLALTINLDLAGVCVSPGSACSSGSIEPSPVALAMGVPSDVAAGAIRISLGPTNSQEDVDHLLNVLPEAVQRAARA